jgi:spermidine synthase
MNANAAVEGDRTRGRRATIDLFLISWLILFLELACIRWFPAHVLFLTFFTNTILLASFLGMSLGCLAAARSRRFMIDTPVLLLVAMVVAQVIGFVRNDLEGVLRVGDQIAPQVVFFGTEYAARDPTRFVIPIEVVEGFFFLMVALVMVGPGQELGRAFGRVPDRLRAYTLNILGSLSGILLFAVCSWLELSPLFWFVPVVVILGYFLLAPSGTRRLATRVDVLPALALVLAVAFWTSGIAASGAATTAEQHWSPYYRVEFSAGRDITVNLIGHQSMVSRDDRLRPSYAYAVPHLLERDAGGPPFGDVLVIGAGSGNDVSRALAWGAHHVDAVEIDPAIQRLGVRNHPDRPYQDPRVTVHIGDGRNFLRVSPTRYDLVVFALVDSLVLHSSYSNIRLESFLFTREAFEDVQKHLKPGGVFVMYNLFRQGWIVDRLSQELQSTFGRPPLVFTLPFVETIEPEASGGFTILMSGATDRVQKAFAHQGSYWLPAGEPPSPVTPNGFSDPVADNSGRIRIAPARLISTGGMRPATDDWPFLYLHNPMLPDLSVRGMAIMGGLAALLFAVFRRSSVGAGRWRLDGRMFFLGAGFMLVETKAVVHMALLFGSTWMVNTIVFAGVLVMVLGANLFVSRVRPVGLGLYYAGLMLVLALNAFVPLDAFLGWSRVGQIGAACLLAFAPILFSGVIFAVSFSRSSRPDQDFGANVAGAMLGGLAENTSMLLGFRYLTLVVMAFYALSAVFSRRPAAHVSSFTVES